jgi:hypothetical protein
LVAGIKNILREGKKRQRKGSKGTSKQTLEKGIKDTERKRWNVKGTLRKAKQQERRLKRENQTTNQVGVE